MNSPVTVEGEPISCDQGDEKTFINKLLGEMKNQFNKSDANIENIETEKGEIMTEISVKSSPETNGLVSDIKLEAVILESSTNNVDEYLIKESFKKPKEESPIKNKDISPGRRSTRIKSNSPDDKIERKVLKRSSRRRSKDYNESILQSAIARKEKSYNESSKPQRLCRQLKPSQKVLENLALAKPERVSRIKSPRGAEKTNESEQPQSDDTYLEANTKRNKKHVKPSRRKLKKLKTSRNNESDEETESDDSLSTASEKNLEVVKNTRRSQRISASRVKEESDEPSDPSPTIADQADDFPDDPECSSVGAQLISSRLCLCTHKTKLYASNSENDVVFCTAVDSISEKLIGCSRKVNSEETSLLRPSQRIPYLVLCDVHKNRLIRHNCCPSCGIFCTQGQFVECEAKHQYHRSCQISVGNLDCCPHCGVSTPGRDIFIKMHCPTAPVFLPVQQSNYPSAKMSFPNVKDHHQADTSTCATPPLLPIEIFQILNAPQLNGHDFTENHLIEAIKDEDVTTLASIIASDYDILHFKILDFNDGTLLHYAAHRGFLKICHLLILAGMELDAFDKEQNTPLMLAIASGRNDVVQYLVRCGASIILKGTDGMTALHMSAKSGNLAATKILLEAGATVKNFVNCQDDGGWTPLVWSCENGFVDVVNFLVVKGADLFLRDVEHNEALHWAAFSGSSHIVELLLNRGCHVNTVNAHGETPLHIAAREDKYNCVIVLLVRGANVFSMNKNNETPLACVPEGGDSANAISLNVELQSLTRYDCKKHKIILSNDISKGRETNPIQCVNTVDNELEPKGYSYITKSRLISKNVKIDTTLKSCSCEDRCTTAECACGKLSLKCWYDEDGKLAPDFNFSSAPVIFECNEVCSCNAITCQTRLVQKGTLQRFQLYKTEFKGWGVKTLRFIPKGNYVCEYVGEILSNAEADRREDDTFLFDLDNKQSNSDFCVDAKFYGNFTRFINHCCTPNLMALKVFVDHQDLRFPRIAFFAIKNIAAEEELSFDYGLKFWQAKYKLFTCQCESSACKYSEEMINQTLAEYEDRLAEGNL